MPSYGSYILFVFLFVLSYNQEIPLNIPVDPTLVANTNAAISIALRSLQTHFSCNTKNFNNYRNLRGDDHHGSNDKNYLFNDISNLVNLLTQLKQEII